MVRKGGIHRLQGKNPPRFRQNRRINWLGHLQVSHPIRQRFPNRGQRRSILRRGKGNRHRYRAVPNQNAGQRNRVPVGKLHGQFRAGGSHPRAGSDYHQQQHARVLQRGPGELPVGVDEPVDPLQVQRFAKGQQVSAEPGGKRNSCSDPRLGGQKAMWVHRENIREGTIFDILRSFGKLLRHSAHRLANVPQFRSIDPGSTRSQQENILLLRQR